MCHSKDILKTNKAKPKSKQQTMALTPERIVSISS